MSAALIAALRDSVGYLRDDGYHQTAQLMIMAAEEIERLNRRVHALEGATSQAAPSPTVDRLAEIAKAAPRFARFTTRRPR